MLSFGARTERTRRAQKAAPSCCGTGPIAPGDPCAVTGTGTGPAPGPHSGQCQLPPGQALAATCRVTEENKQVPVSAHSSGDACVFKLSAFLLLHKCIIITIITFFIRHCAFTSELGGLSGPLPRSSAASELFRFL